MNSYKILIIVTIISLDVFYRSASAQKFCAKVDFNRTHYYEYGKCSFSNSPIFIIKSYATTPELHPYRKGANYFLTPNYIDSCIMSHDKYSLNLSSRIEAAVYFSASAIFTFVVYDTDRNVVAYQWRVDKPSYKWFIFKGEIKTSIPNAVVHFANGKHKF